MARERECVLILAGHARLLRTVLRQVPHVGVRERVPQAVVDHPVDELAVPRLDAGAHPEDVVRRVGHRLHPADHTLRVARLDRLGGEHDGLEPRAADLVDGERRNGPGKTGVDRRLARGRLAHASLQHVSHDHFFHRGGIDRGATHRLPNHEGAEPRRGQRRQPAQVLADRGAAGGENDGRCLFVWHQFHVQTNGVNALVRTSSWSFATNSSTGSTTCFFPSPRARTATVPASASRCPTTAMYGTLCVSPSRIL